MHGGLVIRHAQAGLIFEILNLGGNDMDIGFIGLGNMGGRMAANLLKAGFRLTV
ncbi:MAG TPA: hypothetical protein DDZ83_17190, partial [Nitrospinae bacterium]|nr:hypothetical protein [Nitrospinota bacterium]